MVGARTAKAFGGLGDPVLELLGREDHRAATFHFDSADRPILPVTKHLSGGSDTARMI